MAYAVAVTLAVIFAALAKVVGLLERPRAVAETSMEAYRVLADRGLGDDAKEAAMRLHARALGWQFVLITTGALVALGVPVVLAWALDIVGVVSLRAVMHALLSWQVLLGVTLLLAARAWYERRRSGADD